ncbi:MAG: Dam family site-specific DNA-(adenine-N6)-methyltransferase [Armatimonadota bacterium]
MITGRFLPHPIPYQGSKRALASKILTLFPKEKVRLYEPFAGSAAVSIAAVANGLASSVVINDVNEPLMNLWIKIIHSPQDLVSSYEAIWSAQSGNEKQHYNTIRDEFNATQDPAHLYYLLARCVKASVRYNSNGEFNQSPDNRRKGAKPETIAKHVFGASKLLRDITVVRHGDYMDAICDATQQDVIYMDPPYQGVSGSRDHRYREGLSYDGFIDAVKEMNRRHLSFIISYDGSTGSRRFGHILPSDLNLMHIEVDAGVSTQSTLLGRKDVTIESLYVSKILAERTRTVGIPVINATKQMQLSLL